MFNRRDAARPEADPPRSTGEGRHAPSDQSMIGPSISIEGTVSGSGDLLVEGEVRGKIELKSNRLTIGRLGRVFADVYARKVCVQGQVDGQLIVSEELEILATATIQGTITAPRVSLQDGARFNGTIDMDPASKALKTAFASADPQSPSASGRRDKTGVVDAEN